MVRSIEHYPSETIVVVHAKVRKALQKVKNATIHDYEFEVYEVHRVTELSENVPFTVYDAENINRDKEDREDYESPDDEDDVSLNSADLKSPVSPTPRSPVLSPVSPTPLGDASNKVKSPRASNDMSRIIADKFASKSKKDLFSKAKMPC